MTISTPESAADPTPTDDRRREANLLASEIMHAVSYEHAVELAERALARRDNAFAQAAVEKERERWKATIHKLCPHERDGFCRDGMLYGPDGKTMGSCEWRGHADGGHT